MKSAVNIFSHYGLCCFLTQQCWLEIFVYCTFNDIRSLCILSTLTFSQEPASCPYLGSDRSSQCSTHRSSWRSMLIQSPQLRLGFPSGLSFFWTSHQNTVYTSPGPHSCHMTCPSHSSWFDHPNNIWWAGQIIKLLIMQYLNTLSLHSYINVKDHVSHPYKTTGKITVLYSTLQKYHKQI